MVARCMSFGLSFIALLLLLARPCLGLVTEIGIQQRHVAVGRCRRHRRHRHRHLRHRSCINTPRAWGCSSALASTTTRRRRGGNDSNDDTCAPQWTYKPLKTSLIDTGTANTAQPWILHLIQAAHLSLVPASAWLAWNIWTTQDKIAALLGDTSSSSSVSAFWILLSHVVLIFGTTVPGLLYHEYEDWQFAQCAANQAKEEGYNNARLRQVFLSILIGLLTLSSALLTLGVYYDNPPFWILLGVVSVAVKLVAPAQPLTMQVLTKAVLQPLKLEAAWNRLTRNQSVLPGLSIWDFGLFLLHSTVACAAYVTLFAPTLLAHDMPAALAVVPYLITAAGGLYEGLVAETSYNQWDHLIGVGLFAIGVTLQTWEFQML